MNRYQINVLVLSHEETEMARFLKDYAQADKNRAGKIMSSVSKVLAYTAQQRLTLRQPLQRLHNEIETFRLRAVTDTLATVKRMETARTEYRGSILWLKDASVQLDPDKQLEKFRRVQTQVKATKLEYDKLKSDVIQKIDLLTASRCNMYSHVLATYQKTLLVFWAKTSRIMSAVAGAFEGYQYYEFTVIKDLAEPSRLLAEMQSSSFAEKSKAIAGKAEETAKKEEASAPSQDDTLIDLNDPHPDEQSSASSTVHKDQAADANERIDALIDISDAQFDDQLLELEKLTTIDLTANAAAEAKSNANAANSDDNLVDLLNSSVEQDKLFSDLLASPPTPMDGSAHTKDSLNTNDFDAHWTAAFGNAVNQTLPSSTDANQASASSSSFLPSSLLSELLTSNSKLNTPAAPASTNPKAKPASGKPSDKANWFDLFAELDPLQNPDAIGKSAGAEADRNC